MKNIYILNDTKKSHEKINNSQKINKIVIKMKKFSVKNLYPQ